MNEFVKTLSKQAGRAVREHFPEEYDGGPRPTVATVCMLIELLLSGKEFRLLPHPEINLTRKQWRTWHHAIHEHDCVFLPAFIKEITLQQIPLPNDITEMRKWACKMVLASLDRLGLPHGKAIPKIFYPGRGWR